MKDKNILDEDYEARFYQEEVNNIEVEEEINKITTTGSNDIVKLFIDDIKVYPLLSVEEERSITTNLCSYRNDYLAYLDKEVIDKSKYVNGYNEYMYYRTKILNHNQRLVLSQAQMFYSKSDKKLTLLDFVSIGNLGLMKAVDKFDASLGYKFSTYAVGWIRQSLFRETQNSTDFIRLPVHQATLKYEICKAYIILEQELNRQANEEDVFNYLVKNKPQLKITRKNFIDTLNYIKMNNVLSLDKELVSGKNTDGDATYLYEYIASNEKTPDEVLIEESKRQQITDLLKKLSTKEQIVISKRFGLDNELNRSIRNQDGSFSVCKNRIPKIYTLEEIGKDLGVSRERIRQIERKGLWRLKNSSLSIQKDEMLENII